MALVKNRLSRSSLKLEINRLPKVHMSLDKLKTVKNKSVNSRKNWRRRANTSFGATARKKKLWSKKTKAVDAVTTTKEGVPLAVVTSAPTYHSDDDDRSGDVDGRKHGSFEWLTQKFGTCCSTTTDAADENNDNDATTNSNDLKEWTAAQNKLDNSSSVVVVQETTKADPDPPPVGDRKNEASSSSSLGGGGGKGWEWILSCCCSSPHQPHQVVDRVVDDRTYECTNIESGESSRSSSCDDDDDEGSDESSQSSQHLAGQWLNLPTMAGDISDISSSDTSDDEESDYESDDERQ